MKKQPDTITCGCCRMTLRVGDRPEGYIASGCKACGRAIWFHDGARCQPDMGTWPEPLV